MSKFYHSVIATLDKFVPQRFHYVWSHPAGPKTIFFWAPLGKWGLVIAGIGDLTRPVEKVSAPQSFALMTTGMIWARWSLIIVPRNLILFVVNCAVGSTGLYQISRIAAHKMGGGAAKGQNTNLTDSKA